ncbi:MAG: efflux RND transporter periplasmic adaptor subunit [Chloroflexota bacterium]
MKRWMYIPLAVVLVVGVVAGFLGLRRSRQAAAAATLQTVAATTGDLTAVVGATGSVRANQSAVLAFQTSGVVERVHVEVGDRVQAGQVLAELEQTSLSAQVILAQADLVAAQRALDQLLNSDSAQAQAQLALAQARKALHDAEYNRTVQQQGNRATRNTIQNAEAQLVLAEDAVSEAEARYAQLSGLPEDDPARAAALVALTNARASRDRAERVLNWYVGRPNEIDQALLDANVALAQAQLADAEREWARVQDGPDPEDIAAAEARVAAAQATVDMARITAPFAGTITAVEIKPGDQIEPGTVAFGLADFSHLLVDVEVSEVDINRVTLGQPVTLTLDAVPNQTYQGRVVEVGLAGVTVQGVVNFPVTVEILNADEQVRPGMTTAVNIVVEQIQDVLLVPNRAVRVQDGQRVVYVLRGGQPTAVPIVLGASSDTDSQVMEGDLRPGDLIVLNPPMVFEANGPPSFMRR